MSFRLKIILGILFIQVLLLAVVVWSNFHFLHISNEVELNKHASTTAAVLAASIRQEVAEENLPALGMLARDVFAQPGIEYVRIRGRGKVLVEMGSRDALARPFHEDFLVDDVEDGIFDVAAEVRLQNQMIGQVELGYSLAEIDSVMMAARRQTATISMIGLGVGLVIALMLGNYFARQLKILRDASRRIASGDIGYQLSVAGSDELAQTARSFNTMSRRLAALYSEKQAALTDAKQTTSELQASKRRVQAVLNNALDAIITIDENGIIESFNPAAEKIFGYDADEVVGQNVRILMPEPYHSEHDRYLQAYLHSGVRKIIGAGREVVGRRKDGTVFPMEVEISEVFIEGRRLFIGIARDITERKQYELELQRARDAVMASSRHKFEFIANVSHELRVPLHEILSMSQLLLESSLEPEQRQQADRIHEAGRTLVTIVNDVLDFSKLEAGRLVLERIPFSVHRTVYEVVHGLRDLAREKGLRLVYLMPPTVPSLLCGDPVRLRQILVNLVDNAVKFTSHGEVVVRVAPEGGDQDRQCLRFEVRDTGVGLTPQQQQRIFETFDETAGTLTRHYGSSGLGLAITRKLVEMMDGRIGVESTPGQGSTFWFTVCLRRSARRTSEPVSLFGEFRRVHVLVVDDNPARRERLIAQLDAAGMTVHGVVDGSHALDQLCTAAANGQPYGLVIFNMNLPGMSGLQLARAIASDSRIAGVRMIVVTSTGYRGDSEEVRRSGISGYLTMPFDENMLLGCVAAVLQLDEEDKDTLITRHNLTSAPVYHQGNVLLVVPDPERQKELAAMLEELDLSVTIAADSDAGLQAMKDCDYDLVLVDASLDDAGCSRLVEAAHRERGAAQEGGRRCRIMLLSATEEAEEMQRRCRALGFDDSVSGPLTMKLVREKFVA